MTCCSEAWCSGGHRWRVCSTIRPGETEEECQHRVNQKATELQEGPLPPDCDDTESTPLTITID